MKRRCATCGYSSDDASFFRREQGGLLRRTQTVCDACSPYQLTQRERRATTSFLAWQPIWLIVILAYCWKDPSQVLGVVVLIVVAALTAPFAIAAHEAGHAVAAAAVGRRVVEVLIGSGPPIARLRIAGAYVTIRRYLLVGGMVRSFAHTDIRSRWRDGVVLVGGAAGNGLVAALAYFALTRLPFADEGLGDMTSAAVVAIMLVNGGMAAGNLLPWKIGGVLASDGLRILGLAKPDPAVGADNRQVWRLACLSEMGRFEQVEAEAAAAARTSQLGPLLVIFAMNAISHRRGSAAALDWYLAQAFDPDTMSPFSQVDLTRHRALLKASVAWDAMETGRPELRELAETFSRQAHEALPEVPAISGMRGAVLSACSDDSEAMEMVLQASRAATTNEEKADFCKAMARALRRRGEAARAAGFEAVSGRSRARMAAQYR